MMSTPILNLSIYLSAIFSPEMIMLICWFLLAIAGAIILIRNIKIKDIFKPHISRGIQGSVLIVASTALAVIISQVIKHLVHAPRPVNMLIQETGYSFPSGHATVSTAFFISVMAVVAMYYHFPHPLKRLIYTVSALLIVGISASRLVLQVHRPIDVAAGVVIGALCAWIVIAFAQRQKRVS